MSHLTYQIENLRTSFIEMMELVKSQLEKSTSAIINHDTEMAEEIIRKETRVNAFELNIEKECENTIALFQPVATDLRLVISILKAVSELERMGDHAEFTAKATIDFFEKPFSKTYMELFQIKKMDEIIIQMFQVIIEGFESKNSLIVRQVFKQDKELNKLFKEALGNFYKEMKEKNANYEELLMLYAICGRMERSGDLLTNLAEEIIFYVEAEVLKHQKMKVKMKEKKDE